jgi:hypothetical protein
MFCDLDEAIKCDLVYVYSVPCHSKESLGDIMHYVRATQQQIENSLILANLWYY